MWKKPWKGAMFFKCIEISSQRHHFLYFLPCKYIFMDDYDGTYNYNSLKYSPSEGKVRKGHEFV
jgi:hypothetical protein